MQDRAAPVCQEKKDNISVLNLNISGFLGILNSGQSQ